MNSNNPFSHYRIEFHILQSFPATCLNRDDVGAPKTALIGGNTRARVSSQCWKRQVRLSMQDFGVKLGIRSKRIADYLAKACIALDADEKAATACGTKISEAFSKDTLFFFSDSEATAFAEYASENGFDAAKLNDKELQKIAKKSPESRRRCLDIALFGRMVAQAAELNVEAAASFSHAISTHKVSNEVEFFTALDDLAEEPGSAHMGSWNSIPPPITGMSALTSASCGRASEAMALQRRWPLSQRHCSLPYPAQGRPRSQAHRMGIRKDLYP